MQQDDDDGIDNNDDAGAAAAAVAAGRIVSADKFCAHCGSGILFAMHFVSNDSRKEDNSESEPILSLSNILQHSEEESPSSRETKSLGRGCDAHVAESESTRIDEICHLVNPDRPQCRICLDIGGEDLIAPCDCKGTQKYVHRSCLDNWRSTMKGFAFSRCTVCRAMFILRKNVPADRCWLRLKFLFLVARDHTFIFAIFNLIFAFLGFLVYKLSGVELREFTGSEEHSYAIAVLAIVMSSFLCGFLISVECAPRINGRHYHLLLIKEYVVEDREAAKDAPKLRASHVSELRMWGLC